MNLSMCVFRYLCFPQIEECYLNFCCILVIKKKQWFLGTTKRWMKRDQMICYYALIRKVILSSVYNLIDVIYSHTNGIGGRFLNFIDASYSHTNGSAVAKFCVPLCFARYDYFLRYQAYAKNECSNNKMIR